MGALDNFLKILQLNEEDEDGEYYDDDYYDDEDEIAEPAPRKKAAVVKESNISLISVSLNFWWRLPKSVSVINCWLQVQLPVLCL